MQAYINRRPVHGPWGGGARFINAYHKHSRLNNVSLVQGHDARPDVILVVALDGDGTDIGAEQALFYKMFQPTCKVVLRVNENDARKGTRHVDDMLIKLSAHVDGTVFVSRWLQQYFNDRGWACKNQSVIINGVDRDIFRSGPKPTDGRLHIVAHHWSDNRMKGADVYEQIDRLVGEHPDRFVFTYVGRHQCSFKHTRVVAPLYGQALGEELGRHHVYVSASRFDPGPNHILEALACGLPTFVHVDGGGGVEFAGKAQTYDKWNVLEEFLLSFDPKRVITNVDSVGLTDWQTCVAEYNAFLEATWRETHVLQSC